MKNTDSVIKVHRLGKKYPIGDLHYFTTFREAIINTLKNPLRKMRALRSKPQEAENHHSAKIIWALKDVSFEVKQGEVMGVIGANGAGKTTLLKILSRITDPTEGQAEISGRVSSLLEVGTGFHNELTARENIYLNGAILGMSRIEINKKFKGIVNFSGVGKFLDTPIKYYSTGMRTRLAFSIAAHLETEIMLVDEVLAVGDAEFQKKCLGKLGEISKSGKTIIFVSHNMNAIESLCTSCILLDKGRLTTNSRNVRNVIKQYLFGSQDDSMHSEWVNSSNEFDNSYFKVTKFYIGNKDAKLQPMPLKNTDDAWIYIEGEIRRLDPALTIGYALYSEEGYLLYWSYQTDTDESRWPKLNLGKNIIRSKLPQRLLNEGTYRLEFISSLHFREWFCQPLVNAPSIFFRIQGDLSDSPYWMMKRAGLLAPILPWERCPK